MTHPNQRVGEYVLLQRINAGTFGEVWKAHHHVWTNQLVAVKIPTDPQYIRNLQREGVAIHGLVHPNIVRPLAFDPFAATPYLAMEFVPGTSLRPVVSRKLPPQDVVLVMKQVLAALTCAHGQGIIHRDIKPENILVHESVASQGYGATGAIKVTDFGLGRSIDNNAAGSIFYSQSLQSPQAQEIAGTLDYMAPEQRNGGQDLDPRVDLYACGVVLFELLTGERPAGTDVPSDLNPAVPKYLDEVFRHAYTRREKRFATAAEFAEALEGRRKPPPIPVAPAPAKATAVVASRPVAAAHGTCPHCRQQVEADDQFCMHCGVQLVENVRRCPQCGAYPDASDQYCIFCGQTLVRVPTLA